VEISFIMASLRLGFSRFWTTNLHFGFRFHCLHECIVN